MNLLNSNQSVSVNLIGNSNGSEVSNLVYKGATQFKRYAVTTNISSYTFEFRDATSGNLITTYTLRGVNGGINGSIAINNIIYKNSTIVLTGLPGSETTFLIPNY